MARKIEVYAHTPYVGSKYTTTVELDEEDDEPLTEEEINEIAFEKVCQSIIEWGYRIIEDNA
jgi:hypothetical protein